MACKNTECALYQQCQVGNCVWDDDTEAYDLADFKDGYP